jgi:hypothetical protein
MASRSCSARLAYPDPGHLSAITIEAQADPCPLRRGRQSDHLVTIDNARSTNIYSVQVSVKSLAKGVLFGSGIDEDHLTIPLIGGNDHDGCAFAMDEDSSNPINTDEIETVVSLHDASVWHAGAPIGNPEISSVKYTLKIK